MKRKNILLVTLLVGSALVAMPAGADEVPHISAYAPQGSVEPGSQTTLTIQLVNGGDGDTDVQTADVVRTTLEARDAPLTVRTGTTVVPRIVDGGVATVDFQIDVDKDAEPGTYELPVKVTYEHDDSVTTKTLSVTIEVEEKARFEITDENAGLSIGDEGTVSFTVENVGSKTAHDAVVLYTGHGQNLHYDEIEFAIGDLEPGETTDVTYTVEVSDGAGAGPRRLSHVVEYVDDDETALKSTPLYAHVTVEKKQALFAVDPRETSVTAGSGTAITFEVTNQGETTISNINAKLFVENPLSSSDDQAYIDELGPGESASVTFQVAASGSAFEKSYPVSVDFQYDNADGETKLSDTYRVPIGVTIPEETGLPMTTIYAGLAALGLVLVLGFTWMRR